MSTLPADATEQDIEDELIVQETMRDSLDDDDVDGREEISRTIAALEERLSALSDQQHHTSSQPGQEQDLDIEMASSASSAAASHALSRSMPGAYPFSHDVNGARQQQQQPLQNGNGQNGYNHNGHGQNGSIQNGSGSNSFQNGGLTSHVHYKRPFETSPSSATGNSAKRPTPTSSRTQTPLPSSSSQRRAHMIEQQRQHELQLRARKDNEAKDAAMAASFSRYPQSSTPSHSSSMAGPSSGPANSFQGFGNSYQATPARQSSNLTNGFSPSYYQYNTEASSSRSMPRPLHASTYTLPSINPQGNGGVKSEHGGSNLPSSRSLWTLPSANTPVKNEVKTPNPQASFQRPRSSVPLQIVDLTGSDEDDDVQEIVDLTRPRPSYPMPGSYPGSLASRNGLTAQNRPQYSGAPPTPSGLPRVMDPAMASTFADLASRSRLHTANGRDGGEYMRDLAQLGHLINGHAQNPANDMVLDEAYIFGQHSRSVHDLVNGDFVDPETTLEDLRKLMENIQPDEDETVADEQDTPVRGMTVSLKPYQMRGLKWMQSAEESSNKGGILADDMGLGKTVQAISLLVTNKSDDPMNKTTLILAPVALLRQWEEEIHNKIKPGPHRLNVYLHHSTHKKRTHKELREFDVVLTTFGTIGVEQKRWERYLLRKANDPQAVPNKDEKCLFIGPDCKWFRVIIDEAQCIKNKSTRTAKAAYQIRAKTRFCLTGTPMMNGVEELYSLVHFLRIKPYSDWTKFNLDFVKPLRQANEETRANAMQRLQVLLKAVLLRRNKQTKFNGRPILTLPERVVEVNHPVFSEDERAFYSGLENQQQIKYNKYVKAGTVKKFYAQILVLLLRLRQACCHPHLIKDYTLEEVAGISGDEMEAMCKTLSEAVVERIKATEGSFECPICLDATLNPAIFVPCGHDTCYECWTRLSDPAEGVANGDADGVTAKCPECRGPIKKKSVVDYKCFQKIWMPTAAEAEAATELDPADAETESDADSDSDDSDSDSEDDDEDDDEDAKADPTLGGFIVNDEIDSQAETESEAETDDPEDDGSKPVTNGKDLQKTEDTKASTSMFTTSATASSSKPSKKSKKSKKRKDKGKGKAKEKKKKTKKSHQTIAELKKLASSSASHKKEYLRMISKDYVSSAKLEKTMEIIQGIMKAPDKEKIIIFSQWTSLLDLLEIEIDQARFGYRRYDGSMNAKMRGDAVDDFKNKDKVRMMLVSLKAGNAGLNLNVASQVIILDPFWNPYIEEQAIDRAHRLGQTRPVHVHRLLVEETVEDRILALQEKKRQVISEALDEKAAKSVGRLTEQELGYLFGLNRQMGP